MALSGSPAEPTREQPTPKSARWPTLAGQAKHLRDDQSVSSCLDAYPASSFTKLAGRYHP